MGSPAPSLGAPVCPPAVYRQRRPRATSLYQLLDTHYEKLKPLWEQRFERRFYYDTGALGPRRRWAFVIGLPTNGSSVHVRLEVEVVGATLFTDAAYEAATRP